MSLEFEYSVSGFLQNLHQVDPLYCPMRPAEFVISLCASDAEFRSEVYQDLLRHGIQFSEVYFDAVILSFISVT